jgi:hypothetical protein
MQLGSWDVEVNGQNYAVSVDRAENGKDMIRVNGRVAAKPIGAEESTRPVIVGGWPYTLKRVSANAYDLEVDEAPQPSPAALAREVQERDSHLDALSVLARSNAPVAIKQDPFYRRLPSLGWIVIVLAVAGMMYMMMGPSYEKIAAARVQRVFSEMHDMKGSQFAVTFWFKNKRVLDTTEMSIASDGFTKWSMAKDMYRKIGEFEVLDSKEVKDAPVPTAIVHVKVEGNPYTLLVKKDLPLEWGE